MKKEYKLKKMKWEPVKNKFKNSKIAKTIRIDMDVFCWLAEEAERTGIPYQTLLNSKLKTLMNKTEKDNEILTEKIREIVREEMNKKAS